MVHWHPDDPGYVSTDEIMARLDAIHAGYDARHELVLFEYDIEAEVREIQAYIADPPAVASPEELHEARSRLTRLLAICEPRQ